MTAKDAAELIGLVKPRVAIPIHYDGWAHFQEERADAERELASAPGVRWLEPGVATDV
jgi:L-ascorbate metabolism protein UlaG (beta-lactamase superfamily)